MGTYAIARQDQKLVNVRLDHRLGGVRMARNQILHVRITKRTSHRQHAVDTVVQDQPARASNALAFVFVAALVIV